MTGPRVSVLMSVYNNVRHVDESIRSIVAQTFSDWEMMLIDDASTDGSAGALLRWRTRRRDTGLKERDERAGLAASLNRALNNAGAYVARDMDGDDVAMPRTTARQAAFLDQNRTAPWSAPVASFSTSRANGEGASACRGRRNAIFCGAASFCIRRP